MKIARTIQAPALALVACLTLLAPAPARAQQGGTIYVGTDHGVYVPATDSQQIRVTVRIKTFLAPSDTTSVSSGRYLLDYVDVKGESQQATIESGAAFTYIVDPVVSGVVIDPRTRLRHVNVSFRITSEVAEGQRAPQPSITIEILDRRSGEVASFLAFPGFTGGVTVAAGDVN
jgi:hypothetical protein